LPVLPKSKSEGGNVEGGEKRNVKMCGRAAAPLEGGSRKRVKKQKNKEGGQIGRDEGKREWVNSSRTFIKSRIIAAQLYCSNVTGKKRRRRMKSGGCRKSEGKGKLRIIFAQTRKTYFNQMTKGQVRWERSQRTKGERGGWRREGVSKRQERGKETGGNHS